MENSGDKKNLAGIEAIEKIKELAEDKICHFGTYKGVYDLVTRPMSTQKVDEDGNVWFMCHKLSEKMHQIAVNNTVELMYSNTLAQEYLSVKGKAYPTIDYAKIKEFWNPFIGTWFEKGIDDPNIILIRVEPTDGYYWDTKHGSMIALLKIAASTITGNKDDDGIEGKLNVV